VLLAALPADQARALVEASDLTPRTPHSLTDPNEIMGRIEAARRDGYAVIDQEVELGLRSIAVPLYSVHGRVIAAINTGVAAVQADAGGLAALYLEPLLKVQEGLRRVLR
jgi:IclR family transcriptional regulator, pca regulon regulatory protein